jgi:spore photoproduct lyase
MISAKYINKKINLLKNDSIYSSLTLQNKDYLVALGSKYNFSYQELRQLMIISADFSMWKEKSVSEYVSEIEKSLGPKADKKTVLGAVKRKWNSLKSAKIKYEPTGDRIKSRPKPRKVTQSDSKNEVFGMCPVASEKTVCCNLMTIDAVQGCSLGCSYCSIQTFYTDGKISVDKNLAEKLAKIPLDPNKKYHIGSGQSSDSLAIGNREGVLDAQLNFARNNPNIILEFKTKSDNIDYLLRSNVPNNVFVSWSLNPQLFIDNEEHGTASFNQRISSARALSDKGVLVGFHFHPIVYYEGYELDYTHIIKKVVSMFDPLEVAMISMGTLTFIKPAIKKLRSTGLSSNVLQIPMADAVGKSSYTKEIKKEIFGHVLNQFSSWHDTVFFYLCMEERSVWESVFGQAYIDNTEFENALFNSVSSKMYSLESV